MIWKALWFLIKVFSGWYLAVWIIRPPEQLEADDFYSSPGWRAKRIEVISANIQKFGVQTCEICHTTDPMDGWHVHHIYPRSIYPGLAYETKHMALLCGACNRGISNKYEGLDLRPIQQK